MLGGSRGEHTFAQIRQQLGYRSRIRGNFRGVLESLCHMPKDLFRILRDLRREHLCFGCNCACLEESQILYSGQSIHHLAVLRQSAPMIRYVIVE